MTCKPLLISLETRAVVRLSGEDWRSFLQGLITQDVETLAEGELRFGALLTPQGRILHDLFILGTPDGCLLDVDAAQREALVRRLQMYRLRARVVIETPEVQVRALLDHEGPSPEGWAQDPRLPHIGLRGYPGGEPEDSRSEGQAAYEARRLELGLAGPQDWGIEKTYPIEANFDLTSGIDFAKGCFVGQETTSRMKRRGQIKNRMAPICFEPGRPPAPGAEILMGDRRAGEVLSLGEGRAMALVRLDRIHAGPLTAGGQEVRVEEPDWLSPYLTAPASA